VSVEDTTKTTTSNQRKQQQATQKLVNRHQRKLCYKKI
jgi:hypothetical protein